MKDQKLWQKILKKTLARKYISAYDAISGFSAETKVISYIEEKVFLLYFSISTQQQLYVPNSGNSR